MDEERRRLQRNRGRVAILAFGIMMLGATTPDVGDFFDGDERHDRARIEHHIDERADPSADRAAEMTERAAEMAERAADLADRATRIAAEAADRAERGR